MPELTPDEIKRRLQVIHETLTEGHPLADAARRLSIRAGSLRDWYNNYLASGNPPPVVVPDAPPLPVAPQPEPLTPRETRDAAFYRKRMLKAEQGLLEAEHMIEELAGIRAVPLSIPVWAAGDQGEGIGRSTLIAHTSDVHMGERIDPEEIAGMNGYNPDIARGRMQRYFETVCEIGPRWLPDTRCDGVLLTMAGDLISGDIHEELMRTNALTSHEQVRAIVEIYAAGARLLADEFGHVHIVAVPGNHGRTTIKNTAKLISRLSYDILAAQMLREVMRDDPRITFTIATGADARLDMYGRKIVVSHGHMLGTGGGQGFAGPVLPIIRGGNKLRLQSMSAGMGCDLLLMGHYHTSANPPGILSNGSVVGYSEFGNSIRAAVEPPKQWLARFSEHWGLCETLAVQLEDPR